MCCDQVVIDSVMYVYIAKASHLLLFCTQLWWKKLEMVRVLRICNSLWQRQGGEQTDFPLCINKEKCWSTVILHVYQPSPHSRGMGWHSHDVQTWHKSTSHSLSPPSLLDPWGRVLREGSSELDWGRMEWMNVSGFMIEIKRVHKGETVICSPIRICPCPYCQVRSKEKWLKKVAVRGQLVIMSAVKHAQDGMCTQVSHYCTHIVQKTNTPQIHRRQSDRCSTKSLASLYTSG